MLEALITEVVQPEVEKSAELEIRNIGDVLEWRVNGNLVFSGDWDGNFLEVFKRAIELWDSETKEAPK